MKLFKNFKRKSPAEVALHIFVSAVFMVVALSYVYVFVWALIAGFRTNTEIVMNPFGLPTAWNWKNYIDVFQLLEVNDNNFFHMLFNSVWFSVVGVFIQMFATITFAYCCSKYTFPGAKLPYVIVLIMITLPIYGNGGAMYKLFHSLGLIDSYAHVIASATGFNMMFLYFTAYFKNLSWTYAEAAMMDGADDFQIYFRVMFPQAKPIFGALFLTTWITNWNNYESALIYLPQLPTLPVGIFQFNTEMIYRARLDILFAACVIISIPAIVLFIVFNKMITTNVSVGGIKG